jgi:type I restriction enzyme M protein
MTLSDTVEKSLWETAEKLRGSVEASEYKHIVLGLLFLQDANRKYEKRRAELETLLDDPDAPPEYYCESNTDRDSKLTDSGLYAQTGAAYIPDEASWDYLISHARTVNSVSELLDDALAAIERENSDRLEGKLPTKRYQRANINNEKLASVLEEFDDLTDRSEDTDADFLGRVYEYFIREFAIEEAQSDGAFYTPGNVVQLLVEILRPLDDMRVFDPCCGSGGMFVESQKFAEEDEPDAEISFIGQELNKSTAQLAEMNMFLHGLDADIRHGDSLYDDQFPDTKADRVITNPPFNYSWENTKHGVADDDRFQHGIPGNENANFAFIQHMLAHLKNGGIVGTVMANGALSSTQNNEGEIRQSIVDNDLLDAVITLPTKLFYSTGIPSSIWVFSKGKGTHADDDSRERQGETLFIDAEEMFEKIDRSQNKLSEDHISTIADAVRAYRGDEDMNDYEDVPGFCKVATIEDIADNDYNVNPGRYVGLAEDTTERVPLSVKLPELYAELDAQFQHAKSLQTDIQDNLTGVMNDE